MASVAVILLLAGDTGIAAKNVGIQVTKEQPTVAKPAQPTAPVIQPTVAVPPPATIIPTADEIGEPAKNADSPRTGEQINWQVLASGGGVQTLGSYVLGSTIGQTAVGLSTVGSYQLQSGFWQNFGGGGYLCGDVDHTGDVNISDAVYLVCYIFADCLAPDPMAQGDVDCSADINIADVVYLLNYIFGTGSAPCAACK
jgi:hypothetical protein